MQELYKYFVKGQKPGAEYVDTLPFNLHRQFNSSTIQGRANVAKLSLGVTAILTGFLYMYGPMIITKVSPHKMKKE